MRINGVAGAGLIVSALVLVLVLATTGNGALQAQAVLPVSPDSSSGIVTPNQIGGAPIVAVEVGGVSLGYFNSLSGLGGENDVKEKIVGNTVETNPDKLHWDRIALARGLSSNLDVYNWRKLVVDGQIAQARKDVSVVLYDLTLAEIARFNVSSAWPCRYEVGPITPESTVAVESVQLCHNGFVRVS